MWYGEKIVGYQSKIVSSKYEKKCENFQKIPKKHPVGHLECSFFTTLAKDFSLKL